VLRQEWLRVNGTDTLVSHTIQEESAPHSETLASTARI
jgi:hypothetical protein